MRSARISVDRPGPPSVITRITSSTLKASIRRSRQVTISTGIISGSLMCQICCQAVAPSIRAASSAERGSDCSAASARMKMKGVHCQISAMITDISAFWPSQSTPSKPDGFQEAVKRADRRVVHVAPHQADHDRGDHHRQDEQRAQHRHAADVAVEQQGQPDPDHHLDGDHVIAKRSVTLRLSRKAGSPQQRDVVRSPTNSVSPMPWAGPSRGSCPRSCRAAGRAAR
jgi:hypothetical protein